MDKVAVITGGAGGLGREISSAFSGGGYAVAIHYSRAGAQAQELAREIGGRAMAVQADVSRPEETAEMAEYVYRQWGRVDVLVNNAGITRDSLLARQSEEDWDRVMSVNLKGAFNAIRAFAPLMREGGHIVNISSYSGLKGKEGQAAYSASKAGLLGLTKTAAAELAGTMIRVNAVLPGYMPVGMGIHAGGAREKARDDSLLHALADPKEAARFLVWLAGTRNITGQVFRLDSRML